MITCCEIALVLGITNVISLAIFAGYNMKLNQRTVELEKKNGKEQKQIDQLRKELELLKSPAKKPRKYNKTKNEQ